MSAPSIRSAAWSLALTLAVLTAGLAPAAPSGAASCDPSVTTFDPAITSPSSAIPGWPQRRATTQELIDYTHLVDGQSTLVKAGTFAHAWSHTPLVYALVSTQAHLADARGIASNERLLQDPRRTTRDQAGRIAASSPAIVWYGGNVHGNEPSGGDAALQLLYELAARTDCTAAAIRQNLLVGIIPTQNPDGRTNFARTNGYGFDMNRDWFARTQPETDGKLRLLSKYPPLVFMDTHEDAGNGSARFWFPPDADPIFHEVSRQSTHWINQYYGKAMAAAFDAQNQQDPVNWTHASYAPYDLFYLGYGDSVPTTAFTAAGMTFEKSVADTDQQKEAEQFLAGWTTVATAAERKQAILEQYYQAHVEAIRQGRAGTLQPSIVQQPGNNIQRQVPPLRVRNYFIEADRAYPNVSRELERLMQMGVEIYRLREPLSVPDLHPYGGGSRPGTVPAGSYWIPLDQPQKHWIEGMLGQSPYTPFPYFYDVTAWSNPLLMNLHAYFSGRAVHPHATRIHRAPAGTVETDAPGADFFWFAGDCDKAVAAALDLAGTKKTVVTRLIARAGGIPAGAFVVAKSAARAVASAASRFDLLVHAGQGHRPAGFRVERPKVAVYSSSARGESYDHLRFVLDQVWHLPWTAITGPEVASGGLSGYDVFIVPGEDTSDLNPAQQQISDWISGGGTFIGTARPGGSGGTAFAVMAGYTTSQESTPAGLNIPGTMFRVRLDHSSPVTLGAPRQAYWYNLGEDALSRSTTGANAGVYPSKKPAFWYSGYAEGSKALRGTAALIEEILGSGHVVLFSSEPNYRAYTEGTAFLLANAIAYPRHAGPAHAVDVASASARGAVLAAEESWRTPSGPGRPIVVEVRSTRAKKAADVLRALGATGLRISFARGSAFLTIPNPLGLDVERHPFAAGIIPALRAAGIHVRLAIL